MVCHIQVSRLDALLSLFLFAPLDKLCYCDVSQLSQLREQIDPHSFTHVGFLRATLTDEKNRLSYVCTPAHLQTQPAMTSALREGGTEGGEEKRRKEKRHVNVNVRKEAIIEGSEGHEKGRG